MHFLKKDFVFRGLSATVKTIVFIHLIFVGPILHGLQFLSPVPASILSLPPLPPLHLDNSKTDMSYLRMSVVQVRPFCLRNRTEQNRHLYLILRLSVLSIQGLLLSSGALSTKLHVQQKKIRDVLKKTI